MIKSFSAHPPHTLVVHYRDGRQRTLNLQEWIGGLRSPPELSVNRRYLLVFTIALAGALDGRTAPNSTPSSSTKC